MNNYISNPNKTTISIKAQDNRKLELPSDFILQALSDTHSVIDKISNFGVDIFSILGMRNLSAFIGEVFVASCVKVSKELFVKNPHQDGYPDLLIMDPIGKKHYESLSDKIRDKAPFSPFATGGIEVKATCGSVPTESVLKKQNRTKPIVGETRLEMLKTYDWKAHHRETNNLIALLWDFVDSVPRIRAVFYSNDLVVSDWGEIIAPKEGGGRTTSVSIMTRDGVKKLYDNWVVLERNSMLLEFLDKYNKGDRLKNL